MPEQPGGQGVGGAHRFVAGTLVQITALRARRLAPHPRQPLAQPPFVCEQTLAAVTDEKPVQPVQLGDSNAPVRLLDSLPVHYDAILVTRLAIWQSARPR